MKQIIRLTESDLHRLVKESVQRILAETNASDSGEFNTVAFPMVRRISPVGKQIGKIPVEEGVNWLKGAALGGIMAMSPMQSNAQQRQNYQQNDSIKTSIQQSQQMTIDQLMKLFPQAYKDKDATPQVWQQNQKLYVAEVNGKISLVGKIAASHGQNPWDALVKRYCPQEDDVFQLGDFDI